MFESFIGLVLIVALIAAAIWFNVRLTRMEREHKALLSFVLSSQHPGPQPAENVAHASETAAVSEAQPGQVSHQAAAPGQTSPLEPAETSLFDVPPSEAPASAGAAPVEPVVPDAPIPETSGSAPTAPFMPPRPKRDVETALGTRWAVWVGGLALALGGVFLVRYSIEAGFFGPATRLIMAVILGLLLLAGGEFIRRTGFKVPIEGEVGAFIPAILTAAGAFTLFAAIYAAHGIYGFIGPATAFILLGVVGVATVVMALIHGQALAGLGLLGSLVTPILVASDAPNHWALFGYLAIVLVAATAVARVRLWAFLATSAFVGIGIWTLLYLEGTGVGETSLSIVLFISVVNLATLTLIWLGDVVGERGKDRPDTDGPSIAAALFLGLGLLPLCNDTSLQPGGIVHAGIIVAGMVAAAFWRGAALPLIFGAGTAIVLTYLRPVLSGTFSFDLYGETLTIYGLPSVPPVERVSLFGWLFAALFLVAGVWKARALVAGQRKHAAFWAGWAAAVPVVVAICLWITFGNLDRDYVYAATALAVMLLLAASAEWVARAEQRPLTGGAAVSALLIGSAAAAAAFFHMTFGPLLTTVLIGAAATLPALATRYRSYQALGWLAVGAAIVVLARAAFDPTIVGDMALGRTPVFNALLPGYGIPALAFAFAAWQLARITDGRPRLAMEAAAVLFALLTVGMLVRHAMNGGVIYAPEYTLAEQAIYTLMAFGAGAMLIAIDRRSPSAVMNYGSIAFGVLSVAMAVLQHFLLLNPLFTDESTGGIPVFNLLFLAYLLPALAAGGLALYARGKRPYWYAAMLGLLAAVLAFAYATLSVRRWFQGEFIGLWRDMSQLETYTYSAVWLALGVAILVVGVTLRSHVLRVASAVLIAVAVAKVFLFDMSELEGVLRALSFIGLGAVLIGIGLFYQRLLTRQKVAELQPAPTPQR